MGLRSFLLEYFKALAEQTGIACQTLINMYLTDCAENKRKPMSVQFTRLVIENRGELSRGRVFLYAVRLSDPSNPAAPLNCC